MKIWVVFLVAAVVLGSRAARRERDTSFAVVLGLCVVTAAAFYSYAWV